MQILTLRNNLTSLVVSRGAQGEYTVTEGYIECRVIVFGKNSISCTPYLGMCQFTPLNVCMLVLVVEEV